jgi:hypothetical protein
MDGPLTIYSKSIICRGYLASSDMIGWRQPVNFEGQIGSCRGLVQSTLQPEIWMQEWSSMCQPVCMAEEHKTEKNLESLLFSDATSHPYTAEIYIVPQSRGVMLCIKGLGIIMENIRIASLCTEFWTRRQECYPLGCDVSVNAALWSHSVVGTWKWWKVKVGLRVLSLISACI